MAEAHGTLGEVLVALYLAIAILSFVVARRNGLPAWVTGTAHGLLAIQIIMGIILFVQHPHAMPVSHVVVALLTLPAIGLMAPLRRRIGRAKAVGISSAVVAILAAIALVIAKTH